MDEFDLFGCIDDDDMCDGLIWEESNIRARDLVSDIV